MNKIWSWFVSLFISDDDNKLNLEDEKEPQHLWLSLNLRNQSSVYCVNKVDATGKKFESYFNRITKTREQPKDDPSLSYCGVVCWDNKSKVYLWGDNENMLRWTVEKDLEKITFSEWKKRINENVSKYKSDKKVPGLLEGLECIDAEFVEYTRGENGEIKTVVTKL